MKNFKTRLLKDINLEESVIVRLRDNIWTDVWIPVWNTIGGIWASSVDSYVIRTKI